MSSTLASDTLPKTMKDYAAQLNHAGRTARKGLCTLFSLQLIRWVIPVVQGLVVDGLMLKNECRITSKEVNVVFALQA
jgi:hypothetical protein